MPDAPAEAAPWWLAALALGSNLGDCQHQLERAAQAIDAIPGVGVLASSRLYASPPWGDPDQPEFRNAAVLATTRLAPPALLAACQRIEAALGKVVVRRWGPRAIDIDLLMHGEHHSADPALLLPHPSIRQRPFVYLPLRDLAAAHAWPEAWRFALEGDDAGRSLEGVTQSLPAGASTVFPQGPLWRRAIELELSDEDATHALGAALGRAAEPGLVIALVGDLGAGKTRLVRGLAEGLGLAGPVPSPTFTFCREHPGGRLPLHHWDLYRCADEGDLESIDLDESLASGAVVAIEWADRFAGLETAAAGRVVAIHLEPDPASPDARRARISLPPGHLALRRAVASLSLC